jgi:pimeloyl-ACP methyl ester carboxylesterase
MDPLATAQPDAQGFIAISERVQLHYELYTPPGRRSDNRRSSFPTAETNKSPLLMVMGAFATKAHLASTARHIADACGHEVALYDHRGVGSSTNGGVALEAQKAASLAADALAVADSLWGPTAALHVYG